MADILDKMTWANFKRVGKKKREQEKNTMQILTKMIISDKK